MPDSPASALASLLVFPQLIVGLGNPGAKYDRTRHNIGFEAIDRLARTWNISLSENRKFQGIFGEGRAPNGDKIRLLKPLTYMNLSGQSVRSAIDWYKIAPTAVLVIYDDMDLPLGKLRLRESGSAGGHNGMKSIISHLGTQNFPRCRVGIGAPQNKSQSNGSNNGSNNGANSGSNNGANNGANNRANGQVVSHVLGKFSGAEAQVANQVLLLLQDAIELGLKQGIPKAMSLYNNRSIEIEALKSEH